MRTYSLFFALCCVTFFTKLTASDNSNAAGAPKTHTNRRTEQQPNADDYPFDNHRTLTDADIRRLTDTDRAEFERQATTQPALQERRSSSTFVLVQPAAPAAAPAAPVGIIAALFARLQLPSFGL